MGKRKTPDKTYRIEQVEVLMRPVFPESEGRHCVIIRDGCSQLTTFVGDYATAAEQAKGLASIVRAMYERLTTEAAETALTMAGFKCSPKR